MRQIEGPTQIHYLLLLVRPNCVVIFAWWALTSLLKSDARAPAWDQVGAFQAKNDTQLGLTGNIDIKDELLIRSNVKSKIDFRR